MARRSSGRTRTAAVGPSFLRAPTAAGSLERTGVRPAPHAQVVERLALAPILGGLLGRRELLLGREYGQRGPGSQKDATGRCSSRRLRTGQRGTRTNRSSPPSRRTCSPPGSSSRPVESPCGRCSSRCCTGSSFLQAQGRTPSRSNTSRTPFPDRSSSGTRPQDCRRSERRHRFPVPPGYSCRACARSPRRSGRQGIPDRTPACRWSSTSRADTRPSAGRTHLPG
jgi:hypothetical protein